MRKSTHGAVVGLILVILCAQASAVEAQFAKDYFAYVANVSSNNVSGNRIDGATGTLTPVAGSPFPAELNPYSVTVHPTGQFAYVANYNSNNVSAYTIDGATGTLTPVAGSPFLAGTTPYSVTLDPKGRFAYVTN